MATGVCPSGGGKLEPGASCNVLLLIYSLLNLQVNMGKGLCGFFWFFLEKLSLIFNLLGAILYPKSEVRAAPLCIVCGTRISGDEELVFLNVTSLVNRISSYYSAGIIE